MIGQRPSVGLRQLLARSPRGKQEVADGAHPAERRALMLIQEFESQSSGWFWQTDREGVIEYLSDKVGRLMTPDGSLLPELPLSSVFKSDAQDSESERTLAFHLSSRTSFSDLSISTMDGTEQRWWSISGRPKFDALGRFEGFAGYGNDLTEKRRAEAEIARLARFDSLTGLANRQRMQVALEQMLSQSRTVYRPTALLLLDLDRFKAVNDTLGHQTGDALLQQVAQRLRRSCDETALVGRLGGDEFEVILSGESNRDKLAAIARDIIATLSQPYFISGSSISIGCSIGIARSPDDGDDPMVLVRNADLALYAAKADGRGLHRFYEQEMLADAQSRKNLEDELRLALERGELSLAYQPLVRAADQQIVGCEALMRWQHGTFGPVSPADFIPIAEECGLIERIGEWALRTAIAEAARWPDHVRVAVNVSAIQFANPAFPSLVSSALFASNLAPDRLELEITESVFLANSAASANMFKMLKKLGVRLALDDFGTGYSALAYLKDAPFDKIKIDQSFVRGATLKGNRNVAIIQAIVTLANALGMDTIAEGVETQDEIRLMQSLGCELIQGYVFSKPLPAETLAQCLGEATGAIAPVGFKVGRSPRIRLLRWAKLEIGGRSIDVRVRNLSDHGLMIESPFPLAASRDGSAMVTFWNDQRCPATIRWTEGSQIGLQLQHRIDLEALSRQVPR